MVCEQRIIAQGRTTRSERKRESAEEKIEVEGEAGTTGRPERDRPNRIAQAVRQGIWLWYDDDFCIVLKDRTDQEEAAGRNRDSCEPSTHLENCTGKKRNNKL